MMLPRQHATPKPVGTPRLHRLLSFVAAGLVLFGGCSSFETDAPPVADSTLVATLADLHLAAVRADFYQDVEPGTRDSILAYHGVSAQEFEASIAYYTERPDAYIELFNRVLDHVTEEAETMPPMAY